MVIKTSKNDKQPIGDLLCYIFAEIGIVLHIRAQCHLVSMCNHSIYIFTIRSPWLPRSNTSCFEEKKRKNENRSGIRFRQEWSMERSLPREHEEARKRHGFGNGHSKFTLNAVVIQSMSLTL